MQVIGLFVLILGLWCPKIRELYCNSKIRKKMAAKIVYVAPTVKFLNFRMSENFAVIYIKFKQRGQTLGCFIKKDMNRIANSEDPDPTAPLGAV